MASSCVQGTLDDARMIRIPPWLGALRWLCNGLVLLFRKLKSFVLLIKNPTDTAISSVCVHRVPLYSVPVFPPPQLQQIRVVVRLASAHLFHPALAPHLWSWSSSGHLYVCHHD